MAKQLFLFLALFVATGSFLKAQATLSGLVEFASDSSGNATFSRWDAHPSNFVWNLGLVDGGLAGPFLNGPSDVDADIGVLLPPGSHTFSIFTNSDSNTSTHFGINLFFNGATTPGISAFAARDTSSTGADPTFFSNSGTTWTEDAISQTPGAGTLTFDDGTTAVELIAYRFSDPAVENTDRVGEMTTGANGTVDFVGQFTLMVEDTEAPVITCPAAMIVECTDPGGEVVTFAPTVTDLFDPTPVVVCAPASGAVFPLGTTQVTCTADDASGNSSACMFDVTVQDTTPPTIECVDDIVVFQGRVLTASGNFPAAVVTFSVTANDSCDSSPVVVCSPPSGSIFPWGVTDVTCIATDASGNSAACGFQVLVLPRNTVVGGLFVIVL